MPEIQQFHGVDYFRAPDKIGTDQVAAANNLDFSLIRGGCAVRKGSTLISALGAGGLHLFRFYNKSAAPPWYIPTTGGELLKVTGGFGSPAISTVTDGLVTDVNAITAFGSFRSTAFFASGAVALRENGTDVISWIKQAPSTALSVAVSTDTLVPIDVVGTYTIAEGTTSGGTFDGTATASGTTNGATKRFMLYADTAGTNLNQSTVAVGTSTTTYTVGDAGVHHIDIFVSDPKAIDTISVDYSIGGTEFADYYHAELDVVDGDFDIDMRYQLNEADPTPDDLLDNSPNKDIPPSAQEVFEARSVAIHRNRGRAQRISRAPSTFNTWSIPVTRFELMGRNPGAGFADIQAVRLVVEASKGDVVVQVRNWQITGAQNYGLTDPHFGYAYWETFAVVQTIDTVDVVTDESAHSPVSDRVRISNGVMVVESTNTATDTTITHRILYRQGGNMPNAYAVSTHSVATATITDTLSDIDALLLGNQMVTNLRTAVPEDIRAMAEYRGRLFIGWDNHVGWSLPGNPGALPQYSYTDVSYENDLVQALIPQGNTLVIVNRDSVYNLRGNVFEDLDQDWVLEKSGAKGGSRAPRATIETPFGILLVRDAGLFLYDPGAQVDRPITWAMEKIGDIFRGNGGADPASQKGQRIGHGADQSALISATAAWFNDQIWIAYADDSSSSTSNRPNTVVVLDFRTENAWKYTYPFEINDLLADLDSNAMLAVTPDGGFMRLENSLVDNDAGGNSASITWSLVTRQWTVPSDAVAENMFMECESANSIVATAIFDGTDTDTLGTITNINRDWNNPPLNGVFHNNIQFRLDGTQASGSQTMLYDMQYDLIPEPKRVNFWRTPHELANYDGDKIWDVHFSDIEVIGTGNVLGTVWIDNTAIMTMTITGPTNGRIVFEQSFPVSSSGEPTVGEVAYTTYTSVDPVEFKLWKTSYAARNEPPKMTEFQERISDTDEYLWRNYNVAVDPGGVMTHQFFVDGTTTAITTRTSTGTVRQSYAYEMPLNMYGRTVIVIHRSVSGSFKFYESWWDRTREPDRVKNYQWYPPSWPSNSYPKTLVTELDCLGGTVAGVVYLDSTAIGTETFTGNGRTTYNRALDLDTSNLLQDGTRLEIDYTGAANFKHYDTFVEAERKPFGKKEWAFTFRKLGGATRYDLGIDFSLDVDPQSSGTATITYAWDIDALYTPSSPFVTGTLTYVSGREWREMIALPPGMRSRLFQLRLWSSEDFHVYSAGLDVERAGRKGVSIVAVQGTPSNELFQHREQQMEQTGG